MQTDYDLKKLKVKRRGPLPSLAGEDEKTAKVRVTISLDADIVEHFRHEAAQRGSLPYQTQINQALRQTIEHPDDIEAIKQALLHDAEFLRQIVQRIQQD